jgi:hypothetical protein
MNYNLPSSKICSFLPFLRTLLTKGDNIPLWKVKFQLQKVFLEANFSLKFEKLKKFKERIQW